VRAITAWKTAANISEGALFQGSIGMAMSVRVRLHKDSVGLVVKRAAGRQASIPPSMRVTPYAVLAIQAHLNGAGELAIMRKTGHRSLAMIRRYVREGSLFREYPAANLGL
jgi:hypothetical protein